MADTAAPAATPTLTFVGCIGGMFNIRGEGFGDEFGSVLISGRTIVPTSWSDTVIKGSVPSDVKSGAILVITKDGVEFKGKL